MSKNDLMKKDELETKPVKGLALLLSNKILFTLHSFVYLAVSLLLIVIWAVTFENSISFWPIIPMLGWLIGYGFHVVTYLMYTDKINYLSKIRRGHYFGILFIYHAWFYVIVNVLILTINIMVSLETIFFTWPLFIWGIAIVIHGFGFLTWEKVFDNEMKALKEKHGDYSEKRLNYYSNVKVVQFWLLIMHAAYFIVGNILIYRPEGLLGLEALTGRADLNVINGTIAWGVILGLHALSYIFTNYLENMKPVIKGFLFNVVSYSAINIYLIYMYMKSAFSYLLISWIFYPFVLWGIIIVIHGVITLRFDQIINPELVKARAKFAEKNLEDFELRIKVDNLLFWRFSLMGHVLIYFGGIILISIDMINAGIDINLIIHPAMGWLIGLVFHGAIYYIVLKQITVFFTWTFILHLSVYIPVCIYLVIINVIFAPGVMWSAIAIAGWGIGIGLHLLLAYFTKK